MTCTCAGRGIGPQPGTWSCRYREGRARWCSPAPPPPPTSPPSATPNPTPPPSLSLDRSIARSLARLNYSPPLFALHLSSEMVTGAEQRESRLQQISNDVSHEVVLVTETGQNCQGLLRINPSIHCKFMIWAQHIINLTLNILIFQFNFSFRYAAGSTWCENDHE